MTNNPTNAIIRVGSPIPSPTPRAILSLRLRPPGPGVLVALPVGDMLAVVTLKGVEEVDEGLVLAIGAGDDVNVLEKKKATVEDEAALLEELATGGVDELVDEVAAAGGVDELVEELAAANAIVATGVPAAMENAPSVPHWHVLSPVQQ